MLHHYMMIILCRMKKIKCILNDKNTMKVVCAISFLRKVDRLNEKQAWLIENIFFNPK